jgi:signal transduction histidine kinase
MERIEKLNTFAMAMLESADLEDLLWSIVDNIGHILGYDDCVIYLTQRDVLIQVAAFGIKNPCNRELLEQIEIPIGKGIVGSVAQTGKAEIVEDITNDSRYIHDQYLGQSELTIPVIYENQVIAIIDSESETKGNYNQDDLEFLQIIANIAAPRIASAIYFRDLRQAQSELLDANRALKQKMAELKENQDSLVQAEKMASVGLLASGIAHEINNPLAFSISNLSTLKQYVSEIKDTNSALLHCDGLPQGAKDIISGDNYQYILNDLADLTTETEQGLHRAKQIVSELTGYVRKDGGEITLLDVNQVLHSSLSLLNGELTHKVKIILDLELVPKVLGSERKLSQVFMNIIINAIHASEGKSDILVSSNSNQDFVEVKIKDHGHGIPKQHFKDIFTPFYTTKPIGTGTGLGLFVSYKIVTEDHHGKIEIESDESGSTFQVLLPKALNTDPTEPLLNVH